MPGPTWLYDVRLAAHSARELARLAERAGIGRSRLRRTVLPGRLAAFRPYVLTTLAAAPAGEGHPAA